MEPDDGLPVSPAKEGFSHVPDSYPLDDTLTEPGRYSLEGRVVDTYHTEATIALATL